ncbi:MAG: hypothetical protein ACRDVW_02545 [Acidimicrobiales bacterium]
MVTSLVTHPVGPTSGKHYASAAADTLAPVAISVGIDAAANREIATAIEHVATCGPKLPAARETACAGRAAERSEADDLAAGWAERRLDAAIEAIGPKTNQAERGAVAKDITSIIKTDLDGCDLQ